jgi:SAM-dependent methyltransferase
VVDAAVKRSSIGSAWSASGTKTANPSGEETERTPMNAQELLQEISDYCRRTGLAESTFGRRAVNDGKLASRLRNGGRITTDTLDRIRAFMEHNGADAAVRPAFIARTPETRAPIMPPTPVHRPGPTVPVDKHDPQRNFRFFDNRQKYLLFVNTCSEKWVVAHRVSLELANIHPRPPAVRLFDAGIGDGTVLARVMRSMHDRFPTMPFYVVGKEISLEDIRLTLQKVPDRFVEHPATVLVLTNLAYADAPWLTVKSLSAASRMVWHEVPLVGSTAHRFEAQITDLEGFLAENWKAGVSPKTGNPVYDRPVVLVLYREDHKFLLDPILPKPGGTMASYDLVIASQPYRARAPLEFKSKRVIAPLARALGPGGRLIAIHSHGHDPGLEIVQRVWPGDNPFIHDRHQILKTVKQELGPAGRELNFSVYADNRSLFRYDMHTLPSEVSDSIGTSTLFAAWNAAIYVAQVEDDRLGAVVHDQRYLDATRDVLREHGGLWFYDESYVISRRRD